MSTRQEEHKPREEVCAEDEQGPVCAPYDAQVTSEAEEPWLAIETKLVAGSLVAGIIALVVLATLVHIFLLGGK
jgi:hypothetical protein